MAYFGEGHGPIHLDNIECRGTEHALGQCVRPDTGIHSCWHSEDAGVICDYVEEKVQDIRRTGDMPISSVQESGAPARISACFYAFYLYFFPWLKIKHVLSCTSYFILGFVVSS